MTSESSYDHVDSLSDSWATLSSTDAHSEDDVSTASLIVRSGISDVVSLQGDEDESESQSETESQASEAVSFTFPIEPSQLRYNGSGSASYMSTTSDSIVFEEPGDWPGTETVVLKRTINVYDEQVNPELLGHLPFEVKDGRVIVSVQQTVSRDTLDVGRPFRVLYVGDSKFRPAVLDKIGDVLVTSPCSSIYNGGSSRFHVVPTSYGSDATPNFAELLPIHVQLVVDECVEAASFNNEQHHPPTISLSLKDREDCVSRWTGSDFELSSWTLPDIAIFVLGDNDSADTRNTRHLAHTFMTRYGVPSMVLSESPLWVQDNPMIPFDFHGLHVCLESRDPTTGDMKILGRFPVDITTYENISPGQLSRNLASLITASRSVWSTPELDVTSKSKHAAKMASIEHHSSSKPGDEDVSDVKYYSISELKDRYFSPSNALLRDALLLSTCFITLWLGYAGVKILITLMFQYSIKLFGMAPVWRGNGTPSIGAPFGPGRTVVKPLELPPSSMPTKDLACAVEKSLDINEYILELSRPAVSERTREDQNKFQAHVVGDCHAIIRLPPNIPSGRRSPKFDVKVTRSGTELPFEASKLFDGVYTVRLAREDAYGPITVSIRTRSKPIIDQVLEVDFGTPWLKIANWKRSARYLSSQLRKDLVVAQTGLSEAYNRVSLDIQTMGDALRHEVDTGTRLIKAAEGIMSRSRRASEQLIQEAEGCFASSLSQLRKLLPSVRQDAQCFVNQIRTEANAKLACFQHSVHAQLRLAEANLKQRLMALSNYQRSLASAQKQVKLLSQETLERSWRRFQLTEDGRIRSRSNR